MGQAALGQTDAPAAPTREDQRALFEAMRENPADLDLMFRYALVSIRLEDYEQAIAVLERMLIFEPDLPRVKLELAVAYFRLGAYEVARFYLNDALTADPPDAVRARIDQFLAAIDDRTRVSRFDGFVSLGLLYNTNATLGPDDIQIVNPFTGDPLDDVRQPNENEPAGDAGARIALGFTHSYDLGLPTRDVWLTRAGYIGQRYRTEHVGEFDIVEASTGPLLSLDDDQFGLKGRPFVRGGFVRSGDAPLYWNGGGGAELSRSFGEVWAGSARISGDWRDYVREDDGFDGFYGFASASATYSGVPDTRLVATALFGTDRTDNDAFSNNEIGLRLAALRDVAVPDALEAAGPWTLSAYVQGAGRFYDEADPQVDPTETRRDFDGRVGGRVFAPIDDTFGVALDASYFERFSNIRNYDIDSFEVAVSVTARF